MGLSRPTRLERTNTHVELWFNRKTMADSCHAFHVLKVSLPPAYYIPR